MQTLSTNYHFYSQAETTQWFDNPTNIWEEKLCSLALLHQGLPHFRLRQFLSWCRSKCNISSLDLLKTWAISIHGDRQFSWQCYIFQQDMQFWYTEIGKFPSWFYDLNKICNFYWVDIWRFLGTLWKTDSTNRCCTLSLARRNKTRKLPKISLRKNYVMTMNCSLEHEAHNAMSTDWLTDILPAYLI